MHLWDLRTWRWVSGRTSQLRWLCPYPERDEGEGGSVTCYAKAVGINRHRPWQAFVREVDWRDGQVSSDLLFLHPKRALMPSSCSHRPEQNRGRIHRTLCETGARPAWLAQTWWFSGSWRLETGPPPDGHSWGKGPSALPRHFIGKVGLLNFYLKSPRF